MSLPQYDLSFSTPADRSIYIGVANTALAPMAAFGPLLAGALAERAGCSALLLVLLAIGLAGVLGLHWRVPTPTCTLQTALGE